MSGAYVAKPAAVVPVDYPPGWDIQWPFPGPLPPGFDWTGYDFENVPAEENDDNGDPIPRIWCKPVSGLHTNEHDDGAWSGEEGAEFWVCLTAEPRKGSITVPFVVSDDTIASNCDPTSYTFTSGSIGNWGNPRKVKLIGKNSGIIDGDVEYGVLAGPSTSIDAYYTGLYGNNGNALDVTSYEEVNKISFTVRDIAGYGSIASQTYRGESEEDYVEIHAAIYQAAAGTTSLTSFISSGSAIVDGWTRYYADGSKEHGGDAQNTSFTALSVEATITESYSYACVSSIRIGGKVGTTDNISCRGRIYFYHDDLLLEDYFASSTHTNADNDQYFGMAGFHSYAILHNADTSTAKLDKTVQTYVDEEEVNWQIEVNLSAISTTSSETHIEDEVSSSASAYASADASIGDGGYATVSSVSTDNDGALLATDSDGITYSVAGTYELLQADMVVDVEDVVNLSAYVDLAADSQAPPNNLTALSSGDASLTFLFDVYREVERDDASGMETKVRKYSYAEDETTLSVSGSLDASGGGSLVYTDEDDVIIGCTFDAEDQLTTTVY